MEEIVKKEVLDAVHVILKNQKQYLDLNKMDEIDKEIIPYIEENFECDINEFKVKKFGAPILVNDKRIIPIVLRYYAMMEDNLNLLSKLEESKYDFGGVRHTINFYVLDRQLSSKFRDRDYIRYITRYGEQFESFYSTLRGLNYHEREKYLNHFSQMLKDDPTVLHVGENNGTYNFLTRRNLELFGKDYLLGLDEKQRNLVNSFYFSVNENSVTKIKELVTKYPNFSMPIPLYKDIFDKFTIDELGTMSYKDIQLYQAADKVGVIDRMKQLLKLNPEFTCPIEFIRYEIFKVLDNETILGLSEEVMKEIANIKFVESKDVFVFPVKKINYIIMKHNIKEKIEGIIHK